MATNDDDPETSHAPPKPMFQRWSFWALVIFALAAIVVVNNPDRFVGICYSAGKFLSEVRLAERLKPSPYKNYDKKRFAFETMEMEAVFKQADTYMQTMAGNQKVYYQGPALIHHSSELYALPELNQFFITLNTPGVTPGNQPIYIDRLQLNGNGKSLSWKLVINARQRNSVIHYLGTKSTVSVRIGYPMDGLYSWVNYHNMGTGVKIKLSQQFDEKTITRILTTSDSLLQFSLKQEDRLEKAASAQFEAGTLFESVSQRNVSPYDHVQDFVTSLPPEKQEEVFQLVLKSLRERRKYIEENYQQIHSDIIKEVPAWVYDDQADKPTAKK